PLTAELYFTSWPLPNRSLLLPRSLSNASDAPYLGEAAILFILTRSPVAGVPIKVGGAIPRGVMLGLILQFALGLTGVWMNIRSARRWLKDRSGMIALLPKVQFCVWLRLLVTALTLLLLGR